jgi:hypothetical protein
VGTPGAMLGYVEDPSLTNTPVAFSDGDTLLLYSDGLTDTQPQGTDHAQLPHWLRRPRHRRHRHAARPPRDPGGQPGRRPPPRRRRDPGPPSAIAACIRPMMPAANTPELAAAAPRTQFTNARPDWGDGRGAAVRSGDLRVSTRGPKTRERGSDARRSSCRRQRPGGRREPRQALASSNGASRVLCQ